jgi:hypothetical protein
VRRRAFVLAVALVLAGCTDDGDGTAEREPRPDRPATSTAERPTTTTTSLGVRLDPGTSATSPCPAVPAMAAPDPRRPRYRLDMALDLAAGAVTGDLAVRFRPDLDTDRLVFRLWPNGPDLAAAGTNLEAGPVTLDGADPVPGEQPDPTTLVVLLGRTLSAGTSIEASLSWRLTLPGAVEDRISRSGDAVRLGTFFPLLAWEPGVGWALEPPTTILGEASTSPAADFDWSLAVPDGLTVLGSGEPEGGRWKATAMRDVGISVGRFAVAEGTAAVAGGVRVVVGVHEGLGEDPAAYRDRVIEALEDLSARFGAYPWPAFSLALTPDFPGGIEYPGHVMQGPGTIGRTTPHEVGHQWFYGLVGNNQGRDPWLDEGLASWAEARMENRLTQFKARIIPPAAKNKVGEPMTFWADKPQMYSAGVYVQGAQALAALGDADLVDCALRVYVAQNAHRVARQPDLVKAAATVFPDAAATLAAYGVKVS